jgi:hypothetical protein
MKAIFLNKEYPSKYDLISVLVILLRSFQLFNPPLNPSGSYPNFFIFSIQIRDCLKIRFFLLNRHAPPGAWHHDTPVPLGPLDFVELLKRLLDRSRSAELPRGIHSDAVDRAFEEASCGSRDIKIGWLGSEPIFELNFLLNMPI